MATTLAKNHRPRPVRPTAVVRAVVVEKILTRQQYALAAQFAGQHHSSLHRHGSITTYFPKNRITIKYKNIDIPIKSIKT